MLLFRGVPTPININSGHLNLTFHTLPEGTPINILSPTTLTVGEQPYTLLPGKFVITNGAPVSANEGTTDRHFSSTKP